MKDSLKLTKIENEKQYFEYCDLLEKLLDINDILYQYKVDILTQLIEEWDDNHNTLNGEI